MPTQIYIDTETGEPMLRPTPQRKNQIAATKTTDASGRPALCIQVTAIVAIEDFATFQAELHRVCRAVAKLNP